MQVSLLCPQDILLKLFEDFEFNETLSYQSVCHHWKLSLKKFQPKSLSLEEFSCSLKTVLAWFKRMKNRNKHVFQKLECLNISTTFLTLRHIAQYCYYFKGSKSLTTLLAFTHPHKRYFYSSKPVNIYLLDFLPNLKYFYTNIIPTPLFAPYSLILQIQIEDRKHFTHGFYEFVFGKSLKTSTEPIPLHLSGDSYNDFPHKEYFSKRIRNLYLLSTLMTLMKVEKI
jgi:hypothetical protein